MRSANQYIVIKPLAGQAEKPGVRTPDSALFLGQAEVVEVGSEQCVIDGALVRKDILVPGIAPGKTIHFRKMAEDRLTIDAAYRHKTADNDYVLLLQITDVIGIDA